MPRVLVVDDHAVLRAGLRTLLEGDGGFEVVGEAGDGAAALLAVEAERPDLVVLDLSLPGMGGVEITRRIRAASPSTRVVILTVHEDEGLLREALRVGASGYIVKRAAPAELITALRAVARGEIYVHPSMMRSLVRSATTAASTSDLGPESLTRRELDVLRRIARGYTNRQIADELDLSVRTIEAHRANLMGKLGLQSRVELVKFAADHRLLD